LAEHRSGGAAAGFQRLGSGLEAGIGAWLEGPARVDAHGEELEGEPPDQDERPDRPDPREGAIGHAHCQQEPTSHHGAGEEGEAGGQPEHGVADHRPAEGSEGPAAGSAIGRGHDRDGSSGLLDRDPAVPVNRGDGAPPRGGLLPWSGVPVPSSDPTIADLLARCLRAAGVRRAFRADGSTLPPLAGIEVLDVGDPAMASLLADADGRLATGAGASPGLALLPGRRLRLSSSPGEEVLALPVLSADVVPSAVAGWTLEAVHAAVELEIDVDLDLGAPTPPELDPLTLDASSAPLVRLSPTLAEVSIVIVVGPGVVRDGQVDGVAEAARRTGARVVATPGALGVLPLDDPAWSGVVGLQADDPRLSGVVDAELLVLVGIDPVEAAAVVPPDAQVLEVEPWHLAFMAHTWPEREAAPLPDGDAEPRGRLVEGLAHVARAGRTSDAVPLHPVRALADLFDVVEPDALVLADAGPAGLWLTRGVRSRPAGSAVVPARDVPGFAVAGAVVAGLDHRSAVALVTAPVDPMSEALLDLGARFGVDLTCVVWDGEAAPPDASEHRERLVGARHEGGVQRVAVPVDLAATQELIDLAGPVVAWSADPLDAALG
jgi:hypothetical protein